jgi:anti-sigma regulatory factor (Ser/Thr protein kinase)
VPEASLNLNGDASSVPVARRFVAATLEEWGHTEAGWAAAQIVSELAGNCALHARTDFCVRLLLTENGIRLEVQDGSRARVQPRRYSNQATTGRGLRLVEDLAEQWGVDSDDSGKTVWVALDLAGLGSRSDEETADIEGEVDVDALLAGFDDDDVRVSAWPATGQLAA